MKLKLILTTAAVGAALAMPSASSAQLPAPTQDSATLTEGPAAFFVAAITVLSARSGPSGENPTGRVTLLVSHNVQDFGPVTCLAVSGNIATLNFDSEFSLGSITTLQIVDDNPDTVSYMFGRAPSDCSPLFGVNIYPLTSGDITVVDAQPLQPTSKDQCKNGGWRDFPDFKNQGQCVALVERGPGPQEANQAG